MPVIIFTDESSIELSRDNAIVWRRRGEYPEGCTCEKY